MATGITEDMIKQEVGIKYGIKIVANLFSDCFLKFEDLFSVECIKHHLFYCTFKNQTHTCKNPQCNHVNNLRVKDFKTIYQTKKSCSRNSDHCISDWDPRKDIKINELDLDVFRRLSECKYIEDNKKYEQRKSAVHNMIEFRDAAAHRRSTNISRTEILEAINLIETEEDRALICEDVKRLFHELANTLEITIYSPDDHVYRRESFLKGMLLNVHAHVKEKQQFAYNHLGFYFEDNSVKLPGLENLNHYIKDHQNCLDSMNKSWLLHTVCYFGIHSLLNELLTGPDSKLLPLINNVDYKNQNILMNACEQNHWDIAKDLLRKFKTNWNLYQRDCNGKTALLLCLNKKEMIELFIELKLNIIGLTGFQGQHKSPIDIDKLNLDDPQKEVKNQQTSVQGKTWIALSCDDNMTLSTLLKSRDNIKWEEINYLKTDKNQPQLFLKCDNINNFYLQLEAKPLKGDSKYYRGKQRFDEPINIKNVLHCIVNEKKVCTGLCISKVFEPVLVFPCEDDYRQEYILTNIISNGDEGEIFGNIKKMDEELCVSFQPQSDFLTLECFYVRKRPKSRKYVLTPFQENIILLDCGGTISFPKGCIKQPHTVEIWEKKMEQTNKKFKIKAGTDMVFVHSKVHLTIEGSVKFEFNAPCKANLNPKLLKVHTKLSEYNFEVLKTDIQGHGQTNKIKFEVTDLCGKCVVFCEEEQIPDEILVKEVKLLYLNYKRCTAWFCLEKIANGVVTVQVFIFMHDDDLPNEQKMQFVDYKKKGDLIIRDFCTFHIQCAGSFACKDEQFLHVQFCSEENHIKFEIEVKNNKQQGTFEVEGLPDITKFEVDFPDTQDTNVTVSEQRTKMVTSLKKVIKCADINTESLHDGAYLPDGRLLMTDKERYALLLFDDSVTLQAQYDLESDPYGVCVSADGSLIYVMHGNDTLVTYRLQGGLKKVSHVKVQKGTTGAGVSGDTIIAGYKDDITLYNMKGKKLSSISKKGYPRYICVSQDGSRFYHRDGDHIVCRSVSDLSEVFRYSHPELRKPWGIACDRHGNILVAGWDSGNIIMIDKDGTQGRVLVDKLHGIRRPTGVCCHPQRDEFVVLGWGYEENDNAMEVYEIK